MPPQWQAAYTVNYWSGAWGSAYYSVNRVAIETGGQVYRPPHLSKDQDITIRAGDVIRVSTPGGGGYGDPRQRDPKLVAQDVARGYYTREEAERLFGVRVEEKDS